MVRLFCTAVVATLAVDATAMSTGDYMQLTYETTESTDVTFFKLDEMTDDLVSVSCGADELQLTFKSPEAANAVYTTMLRSEAAEGIVVTGGKQWQCAQRAETASPLSSAHGVVLRMASPQLLTESLTLTDETVVSFATEDAGYHHVFKDAKIRFRTNAYPEHSFRQHNRANDQVQAVSRDASRRHLSFWSTLESIGSTVVSVAEAAAPIIETVAAFVRRRELAESGPATYTDTVPISSFSWNYDQATGGASSQTTNIADGVSCEDCWFQADLGMDFELDIVNNTVTNYKAVLSGPMSSSTKLAVSVPSTDSFDWSLDLADITMDPISFSLDGHPFSVEVSGPVKMDVSATLSADSDLTFHTNSSGTIEYGLQFTDGSWNTIANQNFTSDGNVDTVNAKTTGLVTASVTPEVSLTVDQLGGPTIAMQQGTNLIVDSPDVDDYDEVMQMLGATLTGSSGDRRGLSFWTDLLSVGETVLDDATSYISQDISWAVDVGGTVLDMLSGSRGRQLSWFSDAIDTVESVYSAAEPIVSGIATIASWFRRLDTSGIAIEPVKGMSVGDLYLGISDENFIPGENCALFDALPNKYMDAQARVLKVEDYDDATSNVTMAVTLNYGHEDSATSSQSCISKNLHTWTVDSDGFGNMVVVDAPTELVMNTCTNGAEYPDPSSMVYQCKFNTDSNTLSCSDGDCFSFEFSKPASASSSTSQVISTVPSNDHVGIIVGGVVASVAIVGIVVAVIVVVSAKKRKHVADYQFEK